MNAPRRSIKDFAPDRLSLQSMLSTRDRESLGFQSEKKGQVSVKIQIDHYRTAPRQSLKELVLATQSTFRTSSTKKDI